MTSDENVGLLIEAWKLMVGRMPGGVNTQTEGVATMCANVALPFFNLSTLERSVGDVEDLRGLMEVAKARAAACDHASLLVLTEDWVPADWETVAGEFGLGMMMNLTGMAAEELLPPRRSTPEIELRRVTDEKTAGDLAIVNALAYGMPPEMFECICNMHIWHEDSHGYVGYVDGKAVTAAAALPVSGTIYMALVATLPESRGKGYAEAAMRAAIGSAGGGRITLHASDAGQPVYRAMGFEPGGRMMILGPAHG